ncbi:MAG: DUF2202 domain-containing protein [Lutibacter sp.]|uniref:DUF2202 domain-containing protein n=1 Tax=Lutibacter sp. TaxID=1925666 RepID=UPI00385E8EEC
MRKLILYTLSGFFAILSSCNDNDTIENTIETIISQNEIADLKFLREEEKLARDVYLYSYDKYGDLIFNSIASSEQQHMNSVLTLLNMYQIPDPALVERGVFTDQFLQNLYNDLIELSDVSNEEALKVGALIEDLDINDLDELQNSTSKEEIISVCELLECGSRNHLRSFTDKLELVDFQYSPVYISIEDYNEIITTSIEFCGTY